MMPGLTREHTFSQSGRQPFIFKAFDGTGRGRGHGLGWRRAKRYEYNTLSVVASKRMLWLAFGDHVGKLRAKCCQNFGETKFRGAYFRFLFFLC